MKVNLEKLENSRVALNIEVDAERLEEGLAHAYRKVVKRVTIPGFRKGKAPRVILERTLGKEVLYEDAIDYLLPKIYSEAVEETKIRPVDQPDIDILKLEPGEGFAIKAEVDVFPEVTLGEYTGLEVEKEIETVEDKDVDAVLEDLRQRQAELMAVDSRKDVQEGDYAVIDFAGYIDGQPFPGGAAEDFTLQIGSGQFIPGFEDQMIGMEIGQTKDIVVTFPEDYHAAELAGKEATFKVTVKDLKERVLPELDDEFAKDVSEEANSLAELKAEIRENLEEAATHRTKTKLENKLIEKIIDNSTFDLPQSMIERQVDYLLNDFRMRLMYQGLTLDRYLEMTGSTEEKLREEFLPQATQQLKADLVLEQIADKEGITVSEEEINTKIDELVAGSTDKDQARQRWENNRQDLSASLRIEKTLAFLVENAKITEVPAKPATTADEEEKAE